MFRLLITTFLLYSTGMLFWPVLCGRYTVSIDPRVLIARFNAELTEPIHPQYNAAPSQNLPVISNTAPDKIHLSRWGYIPSWAKSIDHGYSLINARAETISKSRIYRSAFQKRRCLVLSDGFYEWGKIAGRKTPYRITLLTEEPFAFAGIWSIWNVQKDTQVHSFSIITTDANAVVAKIHNRMPVILPPEEEQNWLTNPPEDALELLNPYPAELMKTYAVSTKVNSPKNDSSDLIQPIRQREAPVKRLDEFFS